MNHFGANGIQYINFPLGENYTVGVASEMNAIGSVIGILPTVDSSVRSLNFNLGVTRSSLLITPQCKFTSCPYVITLFSSLVNLRSNSGKNSIPTYLGSQKQSKNIELHSNESNFDIPSSSQGLTSDNVSVVHLDLDGAEESTVTGSDVMLSGN